MSKTFTFSGTKGEDGKCNEKYTAEFGNVCTGGIAAGGHTPGFWSNKNGANQISKIGCLVAAQLLNKLNLFKVGGSRQTFTESTTCSAWVPGFQTWLLNGNAVDMRYMLSVHLAAGALNVAAGYINGGTTLVWLPTNPPAVNNFVKYNDLINAAKEALLLTSGTAAERTYQESLKDALDRANNNRGFVQSTSAACAKKFLLGAPAKSGEGSVVVLASWKSRVMSSEHATVGIAAGVVGLAVMIAGAAVAIRRRRRSMVQADAGVV